MAESMDLFNMSGQQPTQQMVEGQIARIFFKSPDSFYQVLLVQINKVNFSWNEDRIVVTGNFGKIQNGQEYKFIGRLVHHPKYGDQFQATNYKTNAPTSREGLIKYLTGKDFPGIGEATALKVIDNLGVNLIEVILKSPETLKKLNLTEKQYHTLVDGVHANNGIEQIIIALNSDGFGSHLAAQIYKQYHEDTLKVIHDDPYRLVEDIQGISFRRADLIAQKMGITDDDPARLRAGVMAALRQLTLQNGDTYTTVTPLVARTQQLLTTLAGEEFSGDAIAKQMVHLAKKHRLIGDGKRVYLTSLYDAEMDIADNIKRLSQVKKVKSDQITDANISHELKGIENKLGINYDASQCQALKTAMKKPIFLLTGGPGTGKTTIIKGLVSLFARLHHLSTKLDDYHHQDYPILLAAPTGRAAKQMNEATGLPASTIHRLLGLTSFSDESKADPVTKKLKGKILIIDEMSMVDTFLFRLLVQAIPTGMKVIFVGDKNQLPSVGPGQIFHDLLTSKELPSLELKIIHRQSADSTIIPLAHDINEGKLPDDFRKHKADRSFIACDTYQIGSVIRQIVQLAKMKGFTSANMQVLAPMYRGMAGINHLNEIIQQIMNPKRSADQKEVAFHGFVYRIGDKVLQLVNSPENDIFNGDIGKIVGINLKGKTPSSKDELIIEFDQAEVTYARNEWDQITLAYCTSIHKAQGSEFDMVILPMVPQYSRMLKRNLLYTAVTRASKVLVLIGDYQSFLNCVQNGVIDRHTTLSLRIHDLMGHGMKSIPKKVSMKSEGSNDSSIKPKTSKGQLVLTEALIKKHLIDPMIGMNGITPEQFM